MRIKKVSETTPITGNVIDGYSESTTDAYSADYINGLHEYSTTEQRVGTWIDGKPIYRKVLINTGYATTISTSVNDAIDTIVNVKGMVKRGDYPNYYMPIPSRASESTYKLDIQTVVYNSSYNRIDVNFLFGTGIENMVGTTGKIIIILEYTKTTD